MKSAPIGTVQKQINKTNKTNKPNNQPPPKSLTKHKQTK
jgi:hypothetical protein